MAFVEPIEVYTHVKGIEIDELIDELIHPMSQEILQVCRNVVTASRMQSIHRNSTSGTLQQARKSAGGASLNHERGINHDKDIVAVATQDALQLSPYRT